MRRVPAAKTTAGARAITTPPGLSVGPAGGYTPADIATAYGVDPAGGAGQVVGLVEAFDDPTALADLDTFDAEYGLPPERTTGPDPSFEKVSVTGGDPSGLPTAVGTGWDGEDSLDMDAVRGLCHLCRIVMVEVSTNIQSQLGPGVNEAVNLGATVVSNSYGAPEFPRDGSGQAAIDADYNHPGVPILDASGDLGWYGWTNAYNNLAPANRPFSPASLPTVVAVGGTTLKLNSNASRASETVWNEVGASDHPESGRGATGGGCSLPGNYQAPFWQAAVANYAATGCGTARSATDVAVEGDPDTGYDIYDSASGTGKWYTTGGTSLSAPLLAAMWALGGGGHGVTDPGATLYANFTHHPASFFDVTVGGNGGCNEAPAICASDWDEAHFSGVTTNPNNLYNGKYYYVDCAAVPNDDGTHSTDISVVADHNQCFAAPGFDGSSGVGVPQGLGAFAKPTVTALIAGPTGVHRRTATFTAGGLSDSVPGGTVTSIEWSFGDGSRPASGRTQHHTFTKAGRFRVSIVATDSIGASSRIARTITIGEKPALKVSAPTSLKRKKKATFRVSAKDPNTSGKVRSYLWSWGGGQHSKGAKVKHAFTKPGRHKVTLTVTDNQGNTHTRTFKVHVKA